VVPELRYRADIDGLRAIAVLAVVGFHARPKAIPGGFVGVDVFFVISGFLIGSLILTELKSDSFSFLEFYERRARRLFPALIIVLLAVWSLGWFVMLPFEFAALGNHVLAGAAFGDNILLYSEVGYFDVPAGTKPLLHLWSLGVEEQFYIVFPALLSLVRSRRSARLILLLIAIASFAINIATVHSHSSFAFYLPIARFWEFIAGALLAYTQIEYGTWPTVDGRVTPEIRDISACIGILLIVAAIALIPAESAFPGWWAALPILGTLFVIWAGEDAWCNRHLLSNPMLVYIGLISYPLYLWHWPLIVIGKAIVWNYSPNNGYPLTTANIAVALAFVLAWLTYRFIERPVRAWRPSIPLRRVAVTCVTYLALLALLGFVTARSDGLLIRYPSDVRSLLAPLTFGADFPRVDDTKNSYGPLLVTFGDSNAYHLHGGLRVLQNERRFRLAHVGWGDCGPVGWVKWLPPANDDERCRRWTASNHDEFRRLKPEIVVIAAFWPQYRHVEGISEAILFLQSIGVGRIVILGTVPFWPDNLQTLLYKAYRVDPSHRIPTRLFELNRGTLEVDQRLKEIASKLGIPYISVYDVFCDDRGCLVRLGNSARDIIQVDRDHFSAAGAWYLIKNVADQIFPDEPPRANDTNLPNG